MGAPVAIATLVTLLFAVPGLDWSSPGDHLECFSGQMEVTKAEWAAGRSAMPFDVELSSEMDLLTPSGFANALFYACNLKPGSGHMTAPVCSTFVFMSRGSTLRSRTRPLGRSDSQAVRDGNVLAARAFILCLVCAAKFVWWLLEQPGSSCMELHPLFQHMLKMLTIHKLGINMSDFGAPTTKRTLLYSSHREVENLLEYKVEPQLQDREMVVSYTNHKGERRIHGGRDLKGSQAYPKQFGSALCKVRTQFLSKHRRAAKQKLREARKSTKQLDVRPRINKAWVTGADLQSVFDFLSAQP
ncbi:unnamed protein product [Cladocopium goreaui]|uniref:Rhamnose biosynthetic enzyme 1 n=1 Tax=Cladocopium goreaui TaxID=2562237 RepID=A0A9P1FJS4_9DINO|nr:unnamed protein product [Cladocopium goreaui]